MFGRCRRTGLFPLKQPTIQAKLQSFAGTWMRMYTTRRQPLLFPTKTSNQTISRKLQLNHRSPATSFTKELIVNFSMIQKQTLTINLQNPCRFTLVCLQFNVQRYKMSPSKVPSSQIGRLLHYGGLAAGIGFGAISETLRRATSSTDTYPNPVMLTASNIDRLVRKLSRMRGAALKLGQMISIQGIYWRL